MRVDGVVSCMVLAATLAASAAFGGETSVYSACFVPDAIALSGVCRVYVLNPSRLAVRVARVEVLGESVGPIFETDNAWLKPEFRERYVEVHNPKVLWYRVFPNPISPGAICEIIVRLDKMTLPGSLPLTVELDGAQKLSVALSTAGQEVSLDYVSVDQSLSRVTAFVRRRPSTDVALKTLEIDGVRAQRAKKTSFWREVAVVECSLPTPWQRGSAHTVAIVDQRGRRSAFSLRALQCPLPQGIFGNNAESELKAYRDSGFRLHLAFVPVRPELYVPLQKYDLVGAYIYYTNSKPNDKKYEPVHYADPEVVAPLRSLPSLFGYFLEDEPDGRYHVSSLSRPAICRDVERAHTFCRILDPAHPTFLQMNHGSYPANLYCWGQIPDLLCCHAYPLPGPILGPTREHVAHLRAASRPKPFYYLCDGYCSNDLREFACGEFRLEAYAALAEGAKGLLYYPAHGKNGLLAHPAALAVVAGINREMTHLLPYLSRNTPVPGAASASSGVSADLLLCGRDAAAVVLVNTNFKSTEERFEVAPADNVVVKMTLPPWITATRASRAFPSGFSDVPMTRKGETITLMVGRIEDACAAVVR